MKYLQVADVWFRHILAEWLAEQNAADFTVTDEAAAVALAMENAEAILSADGHEIDRYALPLRLAELVADVRWLMARRHEMAAREIALPGDFVLTPHRFSLQYDDISVVLTGREIALLQFLFDEGECNRETLLAKVWRYHPDSDTHTLETHLWRLRQKLQQAGISAPLIITTDKGYRLA